MSRRGSEGSVGYVQLVDAAAEPTPSALERGFATARTPLLNSGAPVPIYDENATSDAVSEVPKAVMILGLPPLPEATDQRWVLWTGYDVAIRQCLEQICSDIYTLHEGLDNKSRNNELIYGLTQAFYGAYKAYTLTKDLTGIPGLIRNLPEKVDTIFDQYTRRVKSESTGAVRRGHNTQQSVNDMKRSIESGVARLVSTLEQAYNVVQRKEFVSTKEDQDTFKMPIDVWYEALCNRSYANSTSRVQQAWHRLTRVLPIRAGFGIQVLLAAAAKRIFNEFDQSLESEVLFASVPFVLAVMTGATGLVLATSRAKKNKRGLIEALGLGIEDPDDEEQSASSLRLENPENFLKGWLRNFEDDSNAKLVELIRKSFSLCLSRLLAYAEHVYKNYPGKYDEVITQICAPALQIAWRQLLGHEYPGAEQITQFVTPVKTAQGVLLTRHDPKFRQGPMDQALVNLHHEYLEALTGLSGLYNVASSFLEAREKSKIFNMEAQLKRPEDQIDRAIAVPDTPIQMSERFQDLSRRPKRPKPPQSWRHLYKDSVDRTASRAPGWALSTVFLLILSRVAAVDLFAHRWLDPDSEIGKNAVVGSIGGLAFIWLMYLVGDAFFGNKLDDPSLPDEGFRRIILPASGFSEKEEEEDETTSPTRRMLGLGGAAAISSPALFQQSPQVTDLVSSASDNSNVAAALAASLEENKELQEQIHLRKEELKTQAALYGFTCTDVSGDGTCFFQAVIHQLDLQEPDEPHQKEALITQAVAEIFDHDHPIDDTTIGLSSEMLRQAYERGEVHGDDRAVIALSRALNRAIVVINSDGSPILGYKTGDAALDNVNKALFLGYEVPRAGTGHYQSLPVVSNSDSNDQVEQINFDDLRLNLEPEVGVGLPLAISTPALFQQSPQVTDLVSSASDNSNVAAALAASLEENKELQEQIHLRKEALDTQAARYGFRCVDTIPDGTCFFQSVAHQLNLLNPGEVHDFNFLIAQAVAEIFDENYPIDDSTLDQYNADRLQQAYEAGTVHGDQKTLLALSRALGKAIVVINSDGSDIIGYKTGDAALDNVNQALFLGYEVPYVGTGHYQSLGYVGDSIAPGHQAEPINFGVLPPNREPAVGVGLSPRSSSPSP